MILKVLITIIKTYKKYLVKLNFSEVLKMDYNFWDDRTHELEINPCKGCEDYQDGKCISDGGCGSNQEKSEL